jgi:uncharacterized membrane protein YphA (DoxX/SURF4 family)
MEGFVKEKIAIVARILLGLIFFVFGLNGFFHFLPASFFPPMPEPAGAFMGALSTTGYMIPLIKIFEIICGIIFLTGFYVPLGLIMIAPGIYNILLFHFFLAPGGLPLAITIVFLHAFLVYAYWHSFCGLLIPKPSMECHHEHEHHHMHGEECCGHEHEHKHE